MMVGRRCCCLGGRGDEATAGCCWRAAAARGAGAPGGAGATGAGGIVESKRAVAAPICQPSAASSRHYTQLVTYFSLLPDVLLHEAKRRRRCWRRTHPPEERKSSTHPVINDTACAHASMAVRQRTHVPRAARTANRRGVTRAQDEQRRWQTAATGLQTIQQQPPVLSTGQPARPLTWGTVARRT